MKELEIETVSNGIKNRVDAYNNFLKLPSAGSRGHGSGTMGNQGSGGGVWSASPDGSDARYLHFGSGNANTYYFNLRAGGFSMRCLKE